MVRERRYGTKDYTFRISAERGGSEANSVDSDAFLQRRRDRQLSSDLKRPRELTRSTRNESRSEPNLGVSTWVARGGSLPTVSTAGQR